MILIKIIFWMYVVGSLFYMVHVAMDHPRKISEVKLGVDIVIFIIKSAIAVGLYFFIWGK